MEYSKMNRAAIGSATVLFIVIAFFLWFFFFRPTATVSTAGTGSNGFNVNIPNNSNTTTAPTDTNGSQTLNTTASSAQKIFEISSGPVVGATLIQTLRPTTTLARYIRQDDGHVYDVPLGVSGAVPKVVSNITIPGGQRALWVEGGNAAIMQYLDNSDTVKTVYMGFPQATTTGAVLPTKIQFLPDNLVDIAASPDGKSVAYLVKTSYGADGYIAKDDGTASRKLFSLPLSQLVLSWPAQNTLLVQTKSAAGEQGIAFSVNASSGVASQLVTALGLAAAADPTFSYIMYQKVEASARATYLHYIQKNIDTGLSYNPIPEKCTWSTIATSSAFCAVPSEYVDSNYLDMWHQGTASAPDSVILYDLSTAKSTLLAEPGSNDGGKASDILEMALSPDEHYLSYTTKGDRSLWGVLLAQ
jgi:hypothetical protein